MKKLLLALLATASLALGGCTVDGNKSENVNNKWKHAHIQIGDKIIHDDIVTYYYYESDSVFIRLELKEHGWVATSFTNVLIYNSDRCPLDNH